MGQPVSLAHSPGTPDSSPKAIMTFIVEMDSIVPLSVNEILSRLPEKTNKPVIIVEPTGVTSSMPPASASPAYKLSDYTKIITSSFRITQYQLKNSRMFYLFPIHGGNITPNSVKDMVDAARLDNYESSRFVNPQDIFADAQLFSSVMQALKQNSSSIRNSAPIRIAGQLGSSTSSLINRRSHEGISPLQMTFMIPPVVTVQEDKLPDNYNLVLPGLYVGNERSATDRDFLIEKNITHVVNLNYPYSPNPHEGLVKYFNVTMNDSVFETLGDSFWKAVEFTKRAIAEGAVVLVHCRMGISRSPALCVAYLIEARGFSFDQAYRMVKSQRPAANINQGFCEQIIEHYSTSRKPKTKMLLRLDTLNMIF